ncbi:hypothetical protein VPH35_139893 [Triticum aestivum]
MATGAAEFQCNVCKELGAGDRYTSRPCDLDLHNDRVIGEATLVHPLFKGSREFQLCHEHPAANKGLERRRLTMVIPRDELTPELRKEASQRCKGCQERGREGAASTVLPARPYVPDVACVQEITRRSCGTGGSCTDAFASVKKAVLQIVYSPKTDESELSSPFSGCVLGG